VWGGVKEFGRQALLRVLQDPKVGKGKRNHAFVMIAQLPRSLDDQS
jgi:hypothetical protein